MDSDLYKKIYSKIDFFKEFFLDDIEINLFIQNIINSDFSNLDEIIKFKLKDFFRSLSYEQKKKRIDFIIEKEYTNLLQKISQFLEYAANEDNEELIYLIEYIIQSDRIKSILGKLKAPVDNDIIALIFEVYNNEKEIEDYDDTYIGYSDITSLYLKDIGKFKILTKEEEILLARKIKNGDKKSKELFINSNLKLVIKVAKKFINRGLDFNDLIGYGNLGLLKAVEKFDASKGYKFSTYATWWINQSIRNGIISDSRNIRLPAKVYRNIENIKKSEEKLMLKLNRKVSNKEISEDTNIPLEQIDYLISLFDDTISLSTRINEEFQIEEFVPDIKQDINKKIDEIFLNESLEKLFRDSKLNKKEREIILLKFGFINDHTYTLEEIAKKYNLTTERIRQIKISAIKKIKVFLEKQNNINNIELELFNKKLNKFIKIKDYKKYYCEDIKFSDGSICCNWFNENKERILLNKKVLNEYNKYLYILESDLEIFDLNEKIFEFKEELNLDKFDINKNIFFKDGTKMALWFLRYKDILTQEELIKNQHYKYELMCYNKKNEEKNKKVDELYELKLREFLNCEDLSKFKEDKIRFKDYEFMYSFFIKNRQKLLKNKRIKHQYEDYLDSKCRKKW